LILVISSHPLIAQIGYELNIGNPYHRFSYVNDSDRDSGLNLYYRPSLYMSVAMLFKHTKFNYGLGIRRGSFVYEIKQKLRYESTYEKSVVTAAERFIAFPLFATWYLYKKQNGSVRFSYEPYFSRKTFRTGMLSVNYNQQLWKRKNRSLHLGAGLRYDLTSYPTERWTTTTNNTQYAFDVRRNPLSFQMSILFNNFIEPKH
jgi:hypothetical protein